MIMMKTPLAIDVQPQLNYMLLVTFDNDEKRLFDCKPYLEFKGFEELRSIPLFNTVKVAGLSVEWPRGQDICPDDLYDNSRPINFGN